MLQGLVQQGSTASSRAMVIKVRSSQPSRARTHPTVRQLVSGYEAVIEDMALPPDYSGPSMAEDLTTQAHFHEA